jgi:O-antigen/teichoic acid export membrane protein
MASTRTSFGPTVTLIAARTLSFVVTFFIPVILVRIFDVATFGAYKQVFLLYVIVYAIAQVGMAESLYYFIPSDPVHAGQVVMNSVILLGVSGLVCVTVLAARAQQVAAWLGNPGIAGYVAPIAVFLLFMLLTSVLEISMMARKHYVLAAWTYFSSDVLRSALLIVPALLFRSLAGLVAGAIAFAAIRVCFCAGYLIREFRGELAFDWPCLRRQLIYALPFELAIIVDTLQTNYHQYTVSHIFGVTAFAIYSIGCLQLPFVDFVAGPAANVMMVRMAEASGDRRNSQVLAIWRDTTRKLALVFLPLFALLVISAREIILLLFTQRYAAAVPIFMLWTVVVPLATLQTESILRVFAQTHFILGVNVLRLGMIAGMIGAFVLTFGVRGAVLITLTATAVSKGLSLVRAAQLMDTSMRQILPWGSLAAITAASAAACLPVWLVKTQLHLPLAPLLAAMGSCFALTYAGLLFGFRLLNEGERLVIASWIPITART